jgi:hypothetical protein
MGSQMNPQQLSSLTRVLEYLEEDEKKDFESASDDMRANHIHLDIAVLEQYLEGQTNKGETIS